MVRKIKNHENQLDLFQEQADMPLDKRFQLLKPAPSVHDYGGASGGDPDGAGHEYPFVQPQSAITIDIPHVALTLQGRAQALMDIMEFYDYENRYEGSKKQLKNPDSEFSQLKGVKNLMENSEQKRQRYFERFMEGIKYLTAEDDLAKIGVVHDPEESSFETRMQSDLNKEFLKTGKVFQKRRDDMIASLNGQAQTFGFKLSSERKNKPKNKK